MSGVGLAAAATTVSTVTFTGWALYITLIEHPARIESGAASGRAQFRASYRRAAPWQASLAAIAFLAGVTAGVMTARWRWLVAAVALGAVIPLTLMVIVPVNTRLLSTEPLSDAETLALLRRWGRLHALRTCLGALGLLAVLGALGQR